MKNFLSIFAVAAICCAGFASCEKSDSENDQEPVPEPVVTSYIDDVTATATSITFTVNSVGKLGYKYAVLSTVFMDEYLKMSGEDPDTMSDADLLSAYINCLAQALSDVFTEVKPITVTAENTIWNYFGGYDIAPETTYYVAAVDVYEDSTGAIVEDEKDIQYVTITTSEAE